MANMMLSDLWLLFNSACFSTIILTVITAQASEIKKFKHFTAKHEEKKSP
jgi:hypothetical protein